MVRVPTRTGTAQPNTVRFTIIAQDPSVRIDGRILTAQVEVPAEALEPGPCGYRVKVVDFDASTNTLYELARYRTRNGNVVDPFRAPKPGPALKAYERRLVGNPAFHAQNVYAIVMRTLARFEYAL